MRIVELGEYSAICEAKGVRRELSLIMLAGESLKPGDYLVAQRGYALEKVSEERALDAWAFYEQMLAGAKCPPDAG